MYLPPSDFGKLLPSLGYLQELLAVFWEGCLGHLPALSSMV